MSAPADAISLPIPAAQAKLIFTCAKCGEEVRDFWNTPYTNFHSLHAKYCTPSKKLAAKAAAVEKRFEELESIDDALDDLGLQQTAYERRREREDHRALSPEQAARSISARESYKLRDPAKRERAVELLKRRAEILKGGTP